MKRCFVVIYLLLPIIVKSQIITRFAGGGTLLGDGGPATAAHIHDAIKGVFDKNGNYYVGDLDGYRVRKVDTSGIITTVAGNGAYIDSGDGLPATGAGLKSPNSVALDSSGNLFICESDGMRVRRVDKITGIITTIAGNGTASSTGDGGEATAATLDDPQDICFDKYGNLYVSEYFSSRVRKINTLGIISNFAGVNGMPGYSGDDGLADTSKIGGIVGLCTDTTGNVYLADNSNSRVFKINTAGIITTVAGTSTGALFNGDEIAATTSNIDPTKITIDDSGNLFIAEYHNYRVRKVDPAGIIHTVAGIGTPGQSGDGGPATAAQFDYPNGVALDACGNLYITESSSNGLVHKVTFDSTCDPYHSTPNPALTVNHINTNTVISIYPNPTNDILHIDNVKIPATYTIQTIVGAAVLNDNLSAGNNTIPLNYLSPGMYILQVIDNEQQRTITKIIKQ